MRPKEEWQIGVRSNSRERRMIAVKAIGCFRSGHSIPHVFTQRDQPLIADASQLQAAGFPGAILKHLPHPEYHRLSDFASCFRHLVFGVFEVPRDNRIGNEEAQFAGQKVLLQLIYRISGDGFRLMKSHVRRRLTNPHQRCAPH
jgi:hypothetical protein